MAMIQALFDSELLEVCHSLILFLEYSDFLVKDKVVAWRNGISEVFQGFHRLSLDKFGRITQEDVPN